MRAGEATALRVGHVDFEHGIIRVSRSLSPGQRGELIEQSPKGHKSREVPLIDALRPYAEQAARGEQPSDLLFSGPDGGRLTNDNARRGVDWDELRKGDRPARPPHPRPTPLIRDDLVRRRRQRSRCAATLGHLSLQVTERYSPACEGVALRAGAAFDRAWRRGIWSRSTRADTLDV
jgi:integrase